MKGLITLDLAFEENTEEELKQAVNNSELSQHDITIHEIHEMVSPSGWPCVTLSIEGKNKEEIQRKMFESELATEDNGIDINQIDSFIE